MELSNNYAVILPAYNEAGRIGATIAGIRQFSSADIIVVNDGSDDDTAAEGSAAGAIVISLPFNLGYGGALQTGFKYALRKGYAYVVQMDADGQHDPAYILPLLEAVRAERVDVTLGSRFLGEGEYSPTLAKRIGMIFFRKIASCLTGQRVTDPTSGFQALGRKALQLYASEVYPVDFPDADVLILLHRLGLRFIEVPVKMNPNIKKKTMHSGFVPVYYIFKMLLSIIVTILRKYEFGRK